MSRTLITRARILALHAGAPFVECGSLVLDGGVLSEVLAEPEPQDAHAERIDAAGGLVLPGLVNAHTHAYSALVRGLDVPVHAADFADLLRQLWWRLDAVLEPEDVQLSATLTAVEGLRLGVTTVFDHHASYGCIDGALDHVAAGFESAGQRAVLCFEVSDRLGQDAARAALAENERYARSQPRLPFRLGALLGLHASFTLSDATLAAAAELAGGSGLGVHVHVAEDGVDRVRAVGGDTGVVERFERFGLLAPGAIAAHAVHLSPGELRRLGELGVAVAHNPRSNMNNGVGRADLGAMQRAGIQVGLGTDAYGAGMLAEARVAHLVQRQHPRAGEGGVDACLLEANPALASAWLPGLGRLAPGSPADVVVTGYVPPTPMDAANVWGHLLFGDVEAQVRTVLVAGERVVEAGRITRVDEVELRARCRERAVGLWERFRAAAPRWHEVSVREGG
jgi:putative selenium metabolism protein SsnA